MVLQSTIRSKKNKKSSKTLATKLNKNDNKHAYSVAEHLIRGSRDFLYKF